MAIKKVSSSLVSFYCENDLAQKISFKAKAEKLTVDEYIISVLEKETEGVEVPAARRRTKKVDAATE